MTTIANWFKMLLTALVKTNHICNGTVYIVRNNSLVRKSLFPSSPVEQRSMDNISLSQHAVLVYCHYKCVIQYIKSPTVTDEVGRRIQFDMTMNSYYSINQGQAVKSSGFRFSKLIDGYGLSLAHISPLIAGNRFRLSRISQAKSQPQADGFA